MNAELLQKTNSALSDVEVLMTGGGANMHSIHRQLMWCRAQVIGEPSEPKQGPLTMSLIATRELDMWGDNSDLAALISHIQRAVE
ncbi:hypothetical protein EOS_26550 [Caballeronia mineralivorans PML1(12)]|uniref:Uncharacterized protein n=1 Tax=Caballeronia mineralivorans PML1(12) TaxID=908627 RepID=A0A0J1CRF0_9BURK|nr:hypothetical protein [Caballeronia mineralivorans]KLU23224.1 hypothetical protein EOS_26550 [Caballeronia mineralivorans PML1(12)]